VGINQLLQFFHNVRIKKVNPQRDSSTLTIKIKQLLKNEFCNYFSV